MNLKSIFIALLTVTTLVSCEPTLVKNTETKNEMATKTPENLSSTNGIADKIWKITLINTDVTTGEASDFYLKLNSNLGTFECKSGCNQINGDYKINNNSIEFSKTVTTKMYCFDTMKFENAFISIIAKPSDFVIIDPAKFILKKDDIVVAQFELVK
jgi:heat shock protein HslJ